MAGMEAIFYNERGQRPYMFLHFFEVSCQPSQEGVRKIGPNGFWGHFLNFFEDFFEDFLKNV